MVTRLIFLLLLNFLITEALKLRIDKLPSYVEDLMILPTTVSQPGSCITMLENKPIQQFKDVVSPPCMQGPFNCIIRFASGGSCVIEKTCLIDNLSDDKCGCMPYLTHIEVCPCMQTNKGRECDLISTKTPGCAKEKIEKYNFTYCSIDFPSDKCSEVFENKFLTTTETLSQVKLGSSDLFIPSVSIKTYGLFFTPEIETSNSDQKIRTDSPICTIPIKKMESHHFLLGSTEFCDALANGKIHHKNQNIIRCNKIQDIKVYSDIVTCILSHPESKYILVLDDCRIPLYKQNTQLRKVYHDKTQLDLTFTQITQCESCYFECKDDIFTVTLDRNNYNSMRICADQSSCLWYNKPNRTTEYIIPSHQALRRTEIQIDLYHEGEKINPQTHVCQAVDICSLHYSYFSKTYAMNPKCWNTLTYIILCLSFFSFFFLCILCVFMSTAILNCLKITIYFFRGLFMCCMFTCSRCSSKIKSKAVQITHQMDNQIHVTQPATNSNNNSQTRKSAVTNYNGKKYTYLTILLIFFLIHFPLNGNCISGNDLSSFTAKTTSCVKKDDNVTCTFDTMTMINIPDNIRVAEFLLKDNNDAMIGQILMKSVRIRYTCNMDRLYYTSTYDFTNQVTFRCNLLINNNNICPSQCSSLKFRDSMPKEALQKDEGGEGESQCVFSTSGTHVAQGCWDLNSHCIFIRNVLYNPTDKYYEVFKCTNFVPTLDVNLNIVTQRTRESFNVNLIPGVKTFVGKDKKMALTLTSVTQPITTLADQKYIREMHSNSRTLLVDANDKGVLQGSGIGRIQCDKFNREPKNFFIGCHYESPLCTCKQTDRLDAKCNCNTVNIEQILNVDSRELPLNLNGYEIIPFGDTIEATSTHEGSTTLQMSMSGFQIQTIYDHVSCELSVSSIKGCYSCLGGVEIKYSCDTHVTKSSINAIMQCDTINIPIECDGSNKERYVIIQYNKMKLKEECILKCPGSIKRYQLEANLDYIPIVTGHNNTQSNSDTGVIQPDLSPLAKLWQSIKNVFNNFIDIAIRFWDFIKGNWWMIVILIVAILVIVFLSYIIKIMLFTGALSKREVVSEIYDKAILRKNQSSSRIYDQNERKTLITKLK